MNLPAQFVIRHPSSDTDFKNYYRVRFETLRQPWRQAEGSEVDPEDALAIHAFITDDDRAVAVCRLHFNNESEAQIRYMGVDEKYRGQGLGAAILHWLEQIAKEKGAEKVILHAREQAIPFYSKQGYMAKEKSYLLFDEIQHYLMVKQLR